MSDIGRWGVVDPMAEANPGLTTYRYCFNNPIMFTDPNGMLEDAAINEMWRIGGEWKNNGSGGFDYGSHTVSYSGSYSFNPVDVDIPELKMTAPKSYQGNRALMGLILGFEIPKHLREYIGVQPQYTDFRPVLHNGSAYMMGGDMFGITDLLGLAFSSMKPENRESAIGLAAIAVILTKGRAAPAILKTELAVEQGLLNEEIHVIRGGTCLACQFENGSGVIIDAKGLLNGVSVNSAKGLSISDLSVGIPNGKIGTTTVSQIKALGGKVIASPTKNNPFHSTLSGITAAQAEKLFNPIIKNPLK
ncbi:hypothetical protein ASG22_19975 [Chryseobacterium sp. Leaf405]|nr:hypothetical protein ASG22_19975 [Chryseobacterium sp. Leaf405]